MTGRGRPTTGTKVQVRIPPDLLARIDAEAEREGVTRAEAVRGLLALGIAETAPGWTTWSVDIVASSAHTGCHDED